MPSIDDDDDDDDDQLVEDVNKFHDFVDRTFALRGDNMPIKRFFLSCSDECDYNRVLDWLRVVVGSKVEILELRFSTAGRYRIRISWDLFMACNNTLVDLTLKDITMLAVDDTQILFPCLKRIQLISIRYTGNQSPDNLIPACPVLQELFLGDHTFCVSWDMFMTCNNTLVDLTLKDVNMLTVVDDDTRLNFPCLKTIKLINIEYTGNNYHENLLPACPVLQDLCLERGHHSDFYTFNISSPSLKRLRIEWCYFGDYDVVIEANKLEYFYIKGEESCGNYFVSNPSCLVEAHIDMYNDLDVQLLTSVSSARIFTLSNNSVLGLSHNEDLNLPVFPNLVKLKVDYRDISEWDLLFVLLNSMPNLQHITISIGYHGLPFKWRLNPPTEAPACLRFMMKEIVIINEEAVQMKDHVTFIRYLLKHSNVLEKLTLNSNNIDREGREKLLKILRRSKSCRVEFV